MPQWVVLLAVAIVGWLLLSVVGGLAVGRLLEVAARRAGDPRGRDDEPLARARRPA